MKMKTFRKCITLILAVCILASFPVVSYAAVESADSMQEIIVVPAFSYGQSGNITLGAYLTIHESQHRLIAISNLWVVNYTSGYPGVDPKTINVGNPIIAYGGEYGLVNVTYMFGGNWMTELFYFYL